MSCGVLDYKYFVDRIFEWVALFRQLVGEDVVAFAMLGVAAAILAAAFHWVTVAATPRIIELVRRYVEQRAKEAFNDKSLQFGGFRFHTTVISIVLGLLFYALVKIGLQFPQHWPYFTLSVLLLVIGFTAWGIFSAPKMYLRPFFQHFYLPVASAIGILVFNAAVEFVIVLAVTVGQLLGVA